MQDICFVTPKGVVTHRLRTTSVAHVFSLYFAKSTSWWECLKFFLTNYKKKHSILIPFRSKRLISSLTGDIMLGFKMTPFLQILIDLFFSEPIAEMAENCLHGSFFVRTFSDSLNGLYFPSVFQVGEFRCV